MSMDEDILADAGFDGGLSSGPDGGVSADLDGGLGVGLDGRLDAGLDGGVGTGPDGGVGTGPDGGLGTGPDGMPGSPLVRVVRGQPTDEELVALVTGLLVFRAGQAPTGQSRIAGRSAWTDRSLLLHARPYGRPAGNWSRSPV